MAKTKGAPRQATVGRLPSKQEILDFLETASGKSGKREIARAFGVKGGDRVALKELLRDMADDGLIAGSRRKLARPGALAAGHGDRDRLARQTTASSSRGLPPGTRSMALRPASSWSKASATRARPPASATACSRASPRSGPMPTTPIRRGPSNGSPARRSRMLGIFRALPAATGVIDPIERKQLKEWPVAARQHERRRERRARPLRARAGARAWRADCARHRAARQSASAADDEPDRRPCPRHPRHLSRRGARRGRRRQGARARSAERICATSRSSPSTRQTRATTTTRCGPRPTPTRTTAAVGW